MKQSIEEINLGEKCYEKKIPQIPPLNRTEIKGVKSNKINTHTISNLDRFLELNFFYLILMFQKLDSNQLGLNIKF